MTSPAFLGEPRVPRISKILEEIRAGEILVSRFQRPFVWNDEQRIALLDSIYNGYPIGAILVWRTQKHQLRTFDRLGPLLLPNSSAAGPTRQYLLDGHQRLTTLFSALGPGLYSRESGQMPHWIAEDKDVLSRWPIYFDLENNPREGSRTPFRLAKVSNQPPTWLPLDILFDSYALREFEEGLRNQKFGRSIVNRVQAVADVFRDYTVPVMPIATEDLERVTISFKRVNSGGTKMNEVHMINALTYRKEFDFLARLDELSEQLREARWHTFDQQMILHICKARVGMSLYDEEPEEIARRILLDPTLLDSVKDDVLRVADVLDRVASVRSPLSLPYSYQAVLLADAVHDINILSSEQIERLRIWFWSTTLTEYFRGMTKSLFERARIHLKAVVLGTISPLPPDLPTVAERALRFDYRAARSRGIALLLAETQKREQPAAARDPFDTLAEFGALGLAKLCGQRDVSSNEKELIESPGNRFLVHPEDVFRIKMLKQGPDLLTSLDVAGHLVDDAAQRALANFQWGDFLRQRRDSIARLEHQRALECGVVYRTPELRLENAKIHLMQLAKEELERQRRSSSASEIEVRLLLNSDSEVDAAFSLEADGFGTTLVDEDQWIFSYQWSYSSQ